MSNIEKMMADIEMEATFTRHAMRNAVGRETLSKAVLDAMRKVPRDKFVPHELQHLAFSNGPLPIGHSQTISQPYIVALMTDLLEPEKDDIILEIGTGSGYQTAVLSRLVKKVYSMELVKALHQEATERLQKLHYLNIETSIGNGYEGWPEHAPYDGIIVTAAASHIPEALVEQLKPGGRLVIPVGLPYFHQELMVVSKNMQGETQTKSVLGVAFVPLVDARISEQQDTEKEH